MPTVHVTFTGLCHFRNDASADPQTGGPLTAPPDAGTDAPPQTVVIA